jgi:hypothetical protein
VQAQFMILKDSLKLKIKNGGDFQDGRQTIKIMQIICNFGFWKIRLSKNIIQQFFFNFKMAE